MVLGKKKMKKGVGIDYRVHVREMKPWPASECLRCVQTVVLQWENGTSKISGSFLAVAGDSDVVFNDSFMLRSTLYKKRDKFRNNYLDFTLLEDKHLLGKASLNLADYGLIQHIVHVDVPLNLNKSYNDELQVYLVITLEPLHPPTVGLSQDELTDDDIDNASSHSSRTMPSPSNSDKNGYGKGGADVKRKVSVWPPSTDASSDTWNRVKDYISSSKFSERSMSYSTSSPTCVSFRDSNGQYSSVLQEIAYSGGKPPGLGIPNGSQKRGKHTSSTDKNEWKAKVEMLEEELREAAAMEVALYSVVAEHSSSKNKVHTPARRLSRFYTSACRAGSQDKRASAAKAVVSGLVLVSRACGNDVSRLSFWLSNAIMLRSIISEIGAEWNSYGASAQDDDLEDAVALLIALERVESWLFSRIVECVWWQCFTPHMQPRVGKSSYRESDTKKKNSGGLGSIKQGNFCIELWKKAFKDAGERLCPIRAGGYECGCLSALLLLQAMEQLVNRLDVAMFNAILRDSGDEMPTDPVSDPIGDSKVLPVPPAKSSFTAGAQLKNIIGNWSRWLADLFGLENSFKSFRLLHALSDLMMLPCGMLADASTRKEVCPSFGPAIIKRVLANFVPDEFSPNPIPQFVMDALTTSEETRPPSLVNTYPYCSSAGTTRYSPPPAALQLTCVGRQVLETSTFAKCCSSDDELDDVDSPLTRILPLQSVSFMPKPKGGRYALRFHLLRDTWRDDHQF